MAKKKTNNTLERTFLFILILMIYTMSTFSASGQMIRGSFTSDELNLNFSEEQQTTAQIILRGNVEMTRATHEFNLTKKSKKEALAVDQYQINDSINNIEIVLPNLGFRRKKLQELQAPLFLISLN